MPKAKRSLNPLPKALRERKRYVLFEIKTKHKLEEMELKNALENLFLSLFGSIGSAEINARLVKFYPEKRIGIICCARGCEKRVRVALMFLKEVKDKPVRAQTIQCSGSLKALQQSL